MDDTKAHLQRWQELTSAIEKMRADLHSLESEQRSLFDVSPLWYVEGTGHHGTEKAVLFVGTSYAECESYVLSRNFELSMGSDYQFVPNGDLYVSLVAGNIVVITPNDKRWGEIFNIYESSK